jgi:hypothetical protein
MPNSVKTSADRRLSLRVGSDSPYSRVTSGLAPIRMSSVPG